MTPKDPHGYSTNSASVKGYRELRSICLCVIMWCASIPSPRRLTNLWWTIVGGLFFFFWWEAVGRRSGSVLYCWSCLTAVVHPVPNWLIQSSVWWPAAESLLALGAHLRLGLTKTALLLPLGSGRYHVWWQHLPAVCLQGLLQGQCYAAWAVQLPLLPGTHCSWCTQRFVQVLFLHR